jgi:ABC-type Fe3+/spermidine/putrescine transport system ATPase subunit
MTSPAIRTDGVSKDFGAVHALRDLDLEVAQGEVFGYLGPNGAGKTTTIRLLLGLARPTAGRAEIFGLDCQRQAVAAHRRLAYVAGEANLWPSLTGAETLHLLGRVQGQVDGAYRDELIARFDLDPGKKVRAYSKGNRQKLMLIAWAGAVSQGTGVTLPSMLGAGISVVAPGLCVLGIGMLALGVWPRATSVVSYGVLAWSLLIELAGGLFGSSHWLLDTSVFHHLAAAPAVSPNWASAAVLAGLGAPAAALGGLAFTRRDLASE